jgi:FkbM family methyltransferase
MRRGGTGQKWRIFTAVVVVSCVLVLCINFSSHLQLPALALRPRERRAADDLTARLQFLLSALAPLLAREGTDTMAVEKAVDILLHAGNLDVPAGGERRLLPDAIAAQRVRLIQIGANKGAADSDPLHHRIVASEGRTPIEGVAVEPVPWLFTQLKESYAEHPHITPLWAAACPSDFPDASAKFFAFRANASDYKYLKGDKMVNFSPSVDEIGSFDRSFLSHMTRADEESLAKVVVEISVPCTNVSRIMCQAGWEEGSLTYLHIDAEGFDERVLRAAELEATRPFMVRLEAQHIDGDSTEAYLLSHGYKVLKFKTGMAEMLAVRVLPSSVPDAGLRCERFLRP